MKINHVYDPWHHLQVEDFLSPDRFDEIKKLAMIEYDHFKKVGSNTFYTTHKEYSSRRKYVRYVEEDIVPETNQFFSMLPEHRGFTGELKKIIHWAITPKNFRYPIHIDNKSRINTCTYYIYPEHEVGTVLQDNPSRNDDGDHNPADQESTRQVEIEWKPNKLFVHNSIPNKTWHSYMSHEERIVLSIFFVQPDLIIDTRYPMHLLDVDPKYYENIL
tara:strand:- start:2461 stop:3111 length:651 start_codon:yes stop_codon:yes gene_type:complete